jgi:Fe-S-cluster-containing dehydrogenase component
MRMVEMAFIVNLDRCIGCHACEIACKDENNLTPGVKRVKVKIVDAGEFNRFYVPIFALDRRDTGGCTLCPQLQVEGRRPACVDNCLTNALLFGEFEEIKKRVDEMSDEKFTVTQTKATTIYVSRKPFNWERINE